MALWDEPLIACSPFSKLFYQAPSFSWFPILREMGIRALTAAPALSLLDEFSCKLLGVMEVLAVPVQSAYKHAVILSWAPEACRSGNHTVTKSRESTWDSTLPSVILAGCITPRAAHHSENEN